MHRYNYGAMHRVECLRLTPDPESPQTGEMEQKRHNLTPLPAQTGESEDNEVNPIWVRGSGFSLVDLLPDALAANLEAAKFENEELFVLDEDALRARYKQEMGSCPSAIENQLRLRLWYEYGLATQCENGSISIRRITTGVCSTSTLYQVSQKPMGAAWLTCQPFSWDAHIDEMVNFGASLEREVMELPHFDAVTKKTDSKLLKIKMEIIERANIRKFGAVPQRIENLHAHVGGTGALTGNAQKAIEDRGDVSTKSRIEDMRRHQKRLTAPPKAPPGGHRIVRDDDEV